MNEQLDHTNPNQVSAEENSVAESEITEAENVKVCPGCNTSLAEGQKFCPNCGAAVEENIPQTLICTNCGTEISSKTKFCPNCGKRIAAPSSVIADEKLFSKKQWLIIGGIVAAVVVVAAVIILCVSLGKNATTKIDFKNIYDEYYVAEWARVGSDNSYLSIDTNPYDYEDYYIVEADTAIEKINRALGLPESLNEEMGLTTWSMGRQKETYTSIGVTVSWSYHPDKGLEVTYKLIDN